MSVSSALHTQWVSGRKRARRERASLQCVPWRGAECGRFPCSGFGAAWFVLCVCTRQRGLHTIDTNVPRRYVAKTGGTDNGLLVFSRNWDVLSDKTVWHFFETILDSTLLLVHSDFDDCTVLIPTVVFHSLRQYVAARKCPSAVGSQ